MDILCERNSSQKQKNESTNGVNQKARKEITEGKGNDDQKLMEDEESLVVLLEHRLQFILRFITKLFVTKNNNSSKKEYV